MRRDDFEKHMNQLLNLLKKILKNYPGGGQAAQFLDANHADKINVNVCFFNFLPLSEDDIEELEEACDDLLDQETGELSAEAKSEFTWDKNDEDFLKQNGMTF
ncbi:MAG: hypothetical protein COV74_07950 [Candidatus Omnitrophica bacterium CG11_big_fil_rev_8_21_14_0_20_45_26]|uniref:Uncharacterized protein n=1 Tax=Candidatus Abzuiibacterium crystallinum TaxID=1974748 RepID=A0A2H0LMG0_9BACT|nr:MAG: hypothetical protein COV74_07950 [Candidatus Omnitrophica bacterium CG11_big_fil_rev_8_21_14_0_20_45_26]PIW65153.1 MAG: hypothetical protein COW12_02990 [Candidatus Omnitrophica bacterium CG12_big_fil_rev_8_21_14_0_65_45_16]